MTNSQSKLAGALIFMAIGAGSSPVHAFNVAFSYTFGDAFAKTVQAEFSGFDYNYDGYIKSSDSEVLSAYSSTTGDWCSPTNHQYWCHDGHIQTGLEVTFPEPEYGPSTRPPKFSFEISFNGADRRSWGVKKFSYNYDGNEFQNAHNSYYWESYWGWGDIMDSGQEVSDELTRGYSEIHTSGSFVPEVPEPRAFALMLAGLTLVGVAARYRRI